MDLSNIVAADISTSTASPTSSPTLAAPTPALVCVNSDNDRTHGLQESSHIVTLINNQPVPARTTTAEHDSRQAFSSLRPAIRADIIDTHRQMEVADHNFPKRTRIESAASVSLTQPSLTKFIGSLWEQIHTCVALEPQLIEGQALLGCASNDGALNDVVRSTQRDLLPSSRTILSATDPQAYASALFSLRNARCHKVTQASRTCRSIEVIVQAHWIEEFDEYANCLASSNPALSHTKGRKIAMMEACRDFGWSEKELRNKMAVWRGYKEIKDTAGWAALIFSGMGLYRLCKYRIGLNQKGFDTLKRLKLRIEVAADTLHPQWRQVLAFVGEGTSPFFTGHPHDWVVHLDGTDPVPLRHTYIESDPFFTFEHLEEPTIDTQAWPTFDPRSVPPVNVVASAVECLACGQTQSEEPTKNQCNCFPSIFGGPRRPAMVQIFRTLDGRGNGLQALTPLVRGTAIGEFVGLVTNNVEGLDVMKSSTSLRSYQIWQGREGNFTKFVNHSCNPNAQLQHFVWLGTQRIILVSKGVDAGAEITVDYTKSYWSGLDKRCLCRESCCRYS